MLNACDDCGNALHECTCEPIVVTDSTALRKPIAPPRTFASHKLGCYTCRRTSEFCDLGRALYHLELRRRA